MLEDMVLGLFLVQSLCCSGQGGSKLLLLSAPPLTGTTLVTTKSVKAPMLKDFK